MSSERILELWDKGCTVTDIMKDTDKSANTIRKVLKANGRESPAERKIRLRNELDTEIARLYKEGYNITQIALRIPCTNDTAADSLQRTGLREREHRTRLSEEDKDRMRCMWAKDGKLTLNELADMFGCRRATVMRIVSDYDFKQW